MDFREARRLFPAVEKVIYLNTAAMAVGNSPARQAYERAVAQWAEGTFDWTEAEQAGEDVRHMFASMIGAQADEVALIPAVSSAAGIVAAQLGNAKPGENVLVAGHEFSSNYYSWLLLKDSGYDVRIVPSTNGMAPAEAYAALADDKTRLIAVSAVHSATGYRADLAALSRVAEQSGAWLFVDACQAAGAVSLDVRRDGVHFLAAASHKFLLGSRGMGYMYIQRELLNGLRPVMPGWKAARKPYESFYGPEMDLSPSASKFDTSLAWFAALAERESLGIFQQVGLDAILERNLELSQRLHETLIDSNVPWEPFSKQRRSTIVSVPLKNPDLTMSRLRDANVVTSLRAGRLRISLHFYNVEEEIDRVAELISVK